MQRAAQSLNIPFPPSLVRMCSNGEGGSQCPAHSSLTGTGNHAHTASSPPVPTQTRVAVHSTCNVHTVPCCSCFDSVHLHSVLKRSTRLAPLFRARQQPYALTPNPVPARLPSQRVSENKLRSFCRSRMHLPHSNSRMHLGVKRKTRRGRAQGGERDRKRYIPFIHC